MKNVFITGGAGYIGSHCAVSLLNNGYNPIIIDNFSNSYQNVIKKLEIITNKKITFYKVDLRDKKKLKSIFNKHHCYAVIHCAGFKAVEESIEKPISYFDNNIGSTLSLLECMQENNVLKIIFSSSAIVYNDTQLLPLKEISNTGNIKNPYGTTKYIIEKILMDLAKSDNKWSIRIARYFNPISNHKSGLIKENPKGVPNNLVPYIVKVAQKKLPYLKVFGNNYKTKDGTCIRDYIHVIDLAEAHFCAAKYLLKTKKSNIFNCGYGRGYSVKEVLDNFNEIYLNKIVYTYKKRRPGDVFKLIADVKKIKRILKWKPKLDSIKKILKSQVKWQKKINGK